MSIIGIDNGSVYLRVGLLEYQRMVRKLAMLDDDRTEDDS